MGVLPAELPIAPRVNSGVYEPPVLKPFDGGSKQGGLKQGIAKTGGQYTPPPTVNLGVLDPTSSKQDSRLSGDLPKRIISEFQSPGAYSGTNVANAVIGETPQYNYSDPYGARTMIEQQLGLGAATDAELAAQGALLKFQDTTRKQINALRDNRDLSTGLEAGFEAARTREATEQEQVLSNQLNLALQKRMAIEGRVSEQYAMYENERNKREAAMLDAMQYGANVNMGMSLEDIVKAGAAAKEEYEEDAAKEKYKSALRETALSLGLDTDGSRKELEKRLKKYYKSEHASEAEMDRIDLALKMKELNKPYYKPESDGLDIDFSNKGLSGLIEQGANMGDDWESIATTLEAAAPGSTRSGSFADRYLRYLFLGEKNPLG